ncbi:M56 family metallopeptidase [Suilimivivens sp.]|uniref:M56 family metallopeptidase n=1 Tax=Suilimivivens sp. TaxID=2981669 RepID=UPI00307ABCBA
MGDIFLKLLNMSITASWLILAVLCIRLLFRKIPKWITCLLWGVVAIRLIFPLSIESAFSLQLSAEPIRTSTMVEGELIPYVPSVDSNIGVVENTVNPLLAEAFAYQETESVAPLQIATEIAGSVWLCGMVVLLIFALVSMIKLRLRVREAVRYKENIYICDAVKSPFILGIIKPRIYLSSALSEEEMDYIIAHERAHLKRKDHLWKPFGYLLLCIYWFNPLCWIAYIMLCKDIELACDEKVIKDMSFGDKKEYSRVLLFCATQRHLVMACPLAFGEVGVKERVKTVLNYKKPTFWITIAAIVVCAIVAICFLTNPAKEYQIRITIPARSETGFYYSDEEICPKRNTLTIAKGGHLGDTEVILLPVEVKEENAYDEPIYITAVAPAKMDVEKGAWFKIGVNMQNPTAEDIDVYVMVRGVEVRIASKTKGDNDSNGESAEEQNSVTPQNLEGPQEPDANEDAVYEELNRVVSTIGLENAYPWNNTVEFKPNADVLIKMASDGSGRFEIYGIMSEKYGSYGLLLNDWIGGEQNWNFALVPWYYSGAPSDQPILESDGKGRYIFAYVYDYDDVPLWHECVLDCGYDTGHMQLIPENEYRTMLLEEEQTALPFESQGENGNNPEEKPIAQTAMVDTSKVFSIVVTNGNTGEQITLTAETSAYNDLIKLYSQLDFTAECAENARVGYQYSMKLQDAEENKLQSVTPYKDGLTVDSFFYQYGLADNGADASLRLMEYLEHIFYPEKTSMAMSFNEAPVNTLPDVTMIMIKYKNYEGDIEIINGSDSELQTGEWFCIQKWEEGSWHRVDELIDGIWKEVAYI